MPGVIALLHARDALMPSALWTAWSFEPVAVSLMVLALALYIRGVRILWNHAGAGRGVSRANVWWFLAGMACLIVALISPLHRMGSALFSAHMTQHELLMVVAAPCLVLGRPLAAVTWGLPERWRRGVATWNAARSAGRLWHAFSSLTVALLVHLVVLLVWHVPRFYQATLFSESVHAIQHAAFLVSAVAFWHGLVRARRQSRGVGVAYLFIAMIATGLLGALLTFANRVWYPEYLMYTEAWGLSALDDQRLGGMIMWIPGGISYLVAALWLFSGWLREPTLAQKPEWGLAKTADGAQNRASWEAGTHASTPT